MQSINLKNFYIDLRLRGHTLGEISKITKRSKTTIYFHIKDIPLTKELINKIKNIRINSVRGKGPKKGKSLLGYKYKKFSNWTPLLVNLVGHMLFDGTIRNSGILYYNRSSALIENFINKMGTVYSGKPKIYRNGGDVIRLAYHNVELAAFFKQKSAELVNSIKSLSLESQRQFLKAFFDDEGSVDFRLLKNSKRRVRGYQHNQDILELISRLLKRFNINSTVNSRFKEILVTKKENIKKFAIEINFSRGLKINGQRANSVWKKSLEKREILKNLINSYKN
ncbi:MAG: LAGLIDADG family homing endonuclease [bacterium]|nr:LAGLIDADG family homing endonuclease [bacterium]